MVCQIMRQSFRSLFLIKLSCVCHQRPSQGQVRVFCRGIVAGSLLPGEGSGTLEIRCEVTHCCCILKARLTDMCRVRVCEIQTKWIKNIRTGQMRTILIGTIFLIMFGTGGFAPNCCKTPKVIIRPRSSFTTWARTIHVCCNTHSSSRLINFFVWMRTWMQELSDVSLVLGYDLS